MPQNQRGSVAVPLILIALFLFMVIAMVNSRREQFHRHAQEAGSLASAERIQQVLDGFTHRYDRYPTAEEFDRILGLVRPVFEGEHNTFTNLPTEPRTHAGSNDPGALNLRISTDCCSDTIGIVGADRTVIWTIIGRVGGETVIYGGIPKKPSHNLGGFNPFPHG